MNKELNYLLIIIFPNQNHTNFHRKHRNALLLPPMLGPKSSPVAYDDKHTVIPMV